MKDIGCRNVTVRLLRALEILSGKFPRIPELESELQSARDAMFEETAEGLIATCDPSVRPPRKP